MGGERRRGELESSKEEGRGKTGRRNVTFRVKERMKKGSKKGRKEDRKEERKRSNEEVGQGKNDR